MTRWLHPLGDLTWNDPSTKLLNFSHSFHYLSTQTQPLSHTTYTHTLRTHKCTLLHIIIVMYTPISNIIIPILLAYSLLFIMTCSLYKFIVCIDTSERSNICLRHFAQRACRLVILYYHALLFL